MTAPRRIEMFASRTGLDEVEFDGSAERVLWRWRSEQALRSGKFYAAGQDFATRSLGYGPSLLDRGRESLTVDVWGLPDDVDVAVDELRAKCHAFGLGKLWSIDDEDVRRWCWAELEAMPTSELGTGSMFNLTHELVFCRLSHWFAEEPTTGSAVLDTAEATVVNVTVSGLARPGAVTWRLRASATSGFINPTLSNLANGQSLAWAREAASANSELRIRVDSDVAEYSNDDGATYASDYSRVTLGTDQARMLELQPGLNPITVEGGANAVLEWSYYAAYA